MALISTVFRLKSANTALVLVLAVLVVLIIYLCYLARDFPCENITEKEVLSLDGRYIATLFERNCGATTDFVTIVSIRDKDKAFRPETDSRVLVIEGSSLVDMHWVSQNTLTLKYNAHEPFLKNERWGDISIEHSAAN